MEKEAISLDWADIFIVIGFILFIILIVAILVFGLFLFFIDRNQNPQKALIIDEKKHRTANYLITMRKGLFRLATAAGLDSPIHFTPSDVMYKDDKGRVSTLEEIYKEITSS
ncbi:hypothetical protein [Radiobacillus kanasensis]|uniref:hypothetical protein n=1 Tax=Radiobacillus kanasensis TaxID=2844358 RepID=UPI002ED92B59